MLKKIFTLLIVILTCFSCTSLDVQKYTTVDIEFVNLYNAWNIQGMEEYIHNFKVKNESIGNPKYRLMLEKRIYMKDSLENMLGTIKSDLEINNTRSLEENLANTLKNRAVYKELKKVDFSNFTVYISKTGYQLDEAKNIIALNLGDDIIYFDVRYEFEGERWVIYDFRERR